MFLQRLDDPGLQVSEDMYQAALRDIMEHLMSDGKTMSDFNLPQPAAAGPRENRLLYQERHGCDMQKMAATLARIPDLNVDQRSVFAQSSGNTHIYTYIYIYCLSRQGSQLTLIGCCYQHQREP